MFCNQCGMNLPDGAAFCPACGTKLPEIPAAPVAPVAPAQIKKKSRAWLWITLAVVLIAAAVAAVLLFTDLLDFGGDKKDAGETPATTQAVPISPNTATEVENIAKEYVAAMEFNDFTAQIPLHLRDYEQELKDAWMEDYTSEEELFSAMSDRLYVKIESWDKLFYECHAYTKEEATEMYGTYTVETTVTETRKLTQTEINTQIAELLDFAATYVDEAKLRAVTEGYMVHINFAIHGTDGTYLQAYEVYVFRYENQWNIALDYYSTPSTVSAP